MYCRKRRWLGDRRSGGRNRQGGLDELQVEIVNLTEILNLLSLVNIYWLGPPTHTSKSLSRILTFIP